MEANELENAVSKALDIFEERQAAKEAEAQRLAEALVAAREEGYETGKAEKEAAMKSWQEERGDTSTPKVTEPGSGGENGDMKAFSYWMHTGDDLAARKSLMQVGAGEGGRAVDGMTAKALQEGTGSEGGFLVPDDFVAEIVRLRDPLSFPRQMGVRVVQTNRDVIDIPAESTSLAVFGRVAEEGTSASDDGAFAQNQVTVHKWMKATVFSTELLEDDATGQLESFYAEALARAMAKTEAQYVGTGSGSAQHLGIFVGGDTDALTFNTDAGADSDGNLLADCLHALYWTLGEGYRSDAAWLCSPATARSLLTLKHTSANPAWAYGAADMFSLPNGVGNPLMVLGKPMFSDSNVSAKSSGVGFLAFGSPAYYALVERKGLSIFRDPYSLSSSSQIKFVSQFRQGGSVLAEEAWVIGVGA